ncbi:MAG TPA: alpha/beta hydrolase [Yinghuangia sp.]|nr:alpha/beta hydrolase [Yinghuangia sp.]
MTRLHRRARALFAASAVALVTGSLTAATGPAAEPAAGSSGHAPYSAAASATVTGTAPTAVHVQWGECPPGTFDNERCGTIRAPLDHDRPGDTRSVTIGVSRSAATGSAEERQGVLVVNFGGPGAAAVGAAAAFAQALPEDVRRAYDIIGFDLRGRGTSSRLDCLDMATFAKAPKPDTALTTLAGQRAISEAARVFAEGCEADAPEMLPYLTTRQIAGDLDLVRAAFGEEKINYLGYSYGTYLGAVYAQFHPDRVRRMVLDSIVDPTRVWYQAGLDQAHAFWLRWHDWADWAARHDAVYGLGDSREAVLMAWNDMRESAAAAPVDGEFGGTEFDVVTIMSLYSDRAWPRFTAALSAYQGTGDATELRELKGTSTIEHENTDSVFHAVTCADAPAPDNLAVFVADTVRLKAEYGYLGANIAAAGPCLHLQSNTRPPVRIGGRDLPAMLLIQSEKDPATPYAGALHLRERMPSARLLTVEGSGNHGQFVGGGQCVDTAAAAYLTRGELPGTDTTCPGLPPPEPTPPSAASEEVRGVPHPALDGLTGRGRG